MLKTEQNTPQVEQEVEQLIATHPETEIHESCTPVFEHNQWFVTCGPCGAIWSVVDVEGGQNDLDLEELESGDESCLENFVASDKTAEVEGDVVCAKCGAKMDSKTEGHEFENNWFCDKCSKEASVEQPVSEKTAEGLLDQFGIWDKFKQWMKTNSSSQQASVEKTAFEPDANSGIRGSNDGTYIYAADVWCPTCAREIADEIAKEGKAPEDPTDERSYDSDDFPKGPFFDEESDAPEYCSGCHIFLENPLTTHGQEYMMQMVDGAVAKGRGDEPHIKEWMDFYEYHPEEKNMEEHESSDASDKINAMPQPGRPKTPAQLGLQEKSDTDLRLEGIPPRMSSEEKEATMDNKQAATEQPISGEDRGFYVIVNYNKYGIKLIATSEIKNIAANTNHERPDIYDLMEDFLQNGWETVNPEDIGALTSGELISDPNGNVYWHERYQIEDMVEELQKGQTVLMQYGGNLFDEEQEIAPPAEPDPNQMNLPLQSSKKEATGEMSQAELDASGREEWPMHYNIADALGAQVKPFDQYQGPYVRVPEGRLWVTTPEGEGDGSVLIVWNESNRKSSEPFMWDDENAAVDAALSVMDKPPANTLPWGAEREEQLKNGPDTSEVETHVPADENWAPSYDEGDKARLKGLGVKGSKKQAAPGDGGLQRDVQNQYENHPLIEMLWGSLKRDPANKDRVQTAWGTKTKQGLVLSVARIMKESPLSGKEASKKTAGHKHTCPECGKSLTCNNSKDCPGEGKKALCGACPKK